MDKDKVPTWIHTPWYNVKFRYPKRSQGFEEHRINSTEDGYKIQYLLTCHYEEVQHELNTMFSESLVIFNTLGEIVIQSRNSSFNFKELYDTIEKLWLNTIATFVVNLSSAAAKDVPERLQRETPKFVSKRAAMIIKGNGSIVCVADNFDFLNETLIDIGYTDIDTMDIRSMLDMKELGIENVSLDIHLQSVKVDTAAKKCIFTWLGRRRRNGIDLIKHFITLCQPSALEFSTCGFPWTKYACYFIFTDHVVNLAFVDYIKSKLMSQWGFAPPFLLIREDERIVLVQAKTGKPGLTHLIQNSLCFHKNFKKYFESEKIHKLLLLNAHKLWFDKNEGVIVCTDDLNEAVVELLNSLKQWQSSKIRKPISGDNFMLFSKFICTLGGDLIDKCRQNFGVDIVRSEDHLTLEGIDNTNIEQCMRFLTNVLAEQSTLIPVENLPHERVHGELARVLDAKICCWTVHCINKSKTVYGCFAEWQDPYGSSTFCLKEIGSEINADVLLELTDDKLIPLAIDFREKVYPRSYLNSASIDLSVGDIYQHQSSALTSWPVVYKKLFSINCYDTKTKRVITQEELHKAFTTFFSMSLQKQLIRVCISVSLNQTIGDKLLETEIVKQLVIASYSLNKSPSEHRTVIIHARKTAADEVINEIDTMFKDKYKAFVRIPQLFSQVDSDVLNIRMKVKGGFIQDEKADVIVCSNTTVLDFGGKTADIIRKRAGEDIVVECRKKYPMGIPECSVAYTNSYGLESNNVKYILHTVLPFYNLGNEQQIGLAVKKCLYLAAELGCESIAFPALGVGGLQYPWRETAYQMFEAVDEFAKQNKSTTLEKIKIVIVDEDKSTLQAFRNEESRRSKKCCLVPMPLLSMDRMDLGAYQRIPETHGNTVIRAIPLESARFPSYAVAVRYASGNVTWKLKQACEQPMTWNDQIIISFGIETVPDPVLRKIQQERVTHLLWHLDSRASLSYGEQINGLVTIIEAMCTSNEMKYLRIVDIIIPDTSALESFRTQPDLPKWMSLDPDTTQQGCTLEIIAKSKKYMEDAKSRVKKMILGIGQGVGNNSVSPLIADRQQLPTDDPDDATGSALTQPQLAESKHALPMTFAKDMSIQSVCAASSANSSAPTQSTHTDGPPANMLPEKVYTVNDNQDDCYELQECELSAVINPGIIQYKLQDGLENWIKLMSSRFHVRIRSKDNLKYCVDGAIENVANFEQYLEKDVIFETLH